MLSAILKCQDVQRTDYRLMLRIDFSENGVDGELRLATLPGRHRVREVRDSNLVLLAVPAGVFQVFLAPPQTAHLASPSVYVF